MSYQSLTTPSAANQEWSSVIPKSGFQNLKHLAIFTLVLAVPNVCLQIYLSTAIYSTGDYSWNVALSGSPWAAVIALLVTTYMLWLAVRGKQGQSKMNGLLVLSMIISIFAFIFMVTGAALSASTTSNIAFVKSDKLRTCIYYNNTKPPTVDPTTLPSDCSNCIPTHYNSDASGVSPRTCCCCAMSVFGGYDGMAFYGVDSCEVVMDNVYPAMLTSSVLYGACALLMLIACITTIIILGRCYCCTITCGPFLSPAARLAAAQTQVTYGATQRPPQPVLAPNQGAVAFQSPNTSASAAASGEQVTTAFSRSTLPAYNEAKTGV